MSTPDSSIDRFIVEELLLKTSFNNPNFVINGTHFGRGECYSDETTSMHFKHKTIDVKCWRIVDENLEELDENSKNQFYSEETYIIQWKSITEHYHFNSEETLNTTENDIYFYWKGEDASKGFSPLPKCLEEKDIPVERIVQWAEPPAFLQLFRGSFVVHTGKHNLNSDPHLYILRGEIEDELHLYEVPIKKESLRSRTSFVVYYPEEKSSIIWHGLNSNEHCKQSVKKATINVFGLDYTEISEGSENDKFLNIFKEDDKNNSKNFIPKEIDFTPRLFYFNKITGVFSAIEIECSHKSSYKTPFPFLQSHLYTAEQPAIFLLDDNDEIWIWYGWEQDDNDEFKNECFITAITYAKQKSKLIQKLVKLHKVIAGLEPENFTNLFPTWKKREDIIQLQEKAGLLPNAHQIGIELILPQE